MKRAGTKLAAAFLAFAVAAGPWTADGAKAAKFPDTAGHWAEETIKWGVEAGIVNGFPDGRFQPNGAVTEAQFTAMLFRAFPEDAPKESGTYWYSAYYKQAGAWLWPLDAKNADAPAKRGKVAQIIAASLGSQLSVAEAVDFLLDRELAQGRGVVNGRVDFGEDAALTRAEAVRFVRNVAAGADGIGAADKPPASAAQAGGAAASVSGLAVGDSEASLLSVMGEPSRKEASEYGFEWYVYNSDYERFSMFGVKDGEIKALYANGANAKTGASFGTPLEYIQKGNTRYMINSNGEYDVYDTGSAFVTVFYDVHEGKAFSALQAIEKETELSLEGYYGEPSERLADSFERISLDLVNSARVKRGLSALKWDDGASSVAWGHSADMAKNGFFDHTNLRGEQLGDRLKDGGVGYRSAGENIAYGQTSAIFAHEGWMNSLGHRKNILGDFKLLGVGVAFAADDVPYYTQNFLTK